MLFEKRGAAGHILLNRPKALNALTHGMCLAMKHQLDAWACDGEVLSVVIRGAGERAFCAGGDIRALYESGKAGTADALDFYRDEYRLNTTIQHFPKPYIALINGIVMGGGVGVSVHGSYRAVDETTVFAMPETGIGLFPDVGGSYFLSRCPGETGMYIALTGVRLKAADLRYVGIATDFVNQTLRENLILALAEGENPGNLMSELTGHATASQLWGESTIALHRDEIDRAFSRESIEAILSVLDAEHSEWCSNTANLIRAKSPTSLKVTFRQIREGAKKTFDDCMRMEYRMVHRVMSGHDFYEGVRATIIDKGTTPHWQPETLAEVSALQVDAYFAPLNGKELTL